MDATAAVLHGQAPLEALRENRPIEFETVDVADPSGEEVLVEVAAASLCHTDLSMVTGRLEERRPLVMGHEGAGIVREVGPDVTTVTQGDHVVLGRPACGRCAYCRQGRSNLCTRRTTTRPEGTLRTGEVGFSVDGEPRYHCHGVSSFSEYTLVTEEVAIPITDEVPLDTATVLGCGVFTGAGAVLNTVDVDVGDAVAVFGAGGVGLSGVQAAALRRADPLVVVDVVAEKLETAADLGATHTVDATERDPVAAVRDLTDGGVDFAFDMVGDPDVVSQLVETLGPLGTAVLVGTPSAGTQDVGIDISKFVTGEKRLVGSFNGSYNLESAIPKLADLVARGDLALDHMISDRLELADLYDAVEALHEGSALRQVLVP